LAVIKTMKEQNLLERAKVLGATMLEMLHSLASDVAIIGDVRGRGAMIAFELVEPGTTTPNAAAAKAIVSYCQQHGVIALICGTYGNVIRLLPPLIISDEQLADGLSVIAAAVRSVQ
jgi:4-aminobutyrate aminotransferase/(S)-3-amino-2-methylpropionate transaminase